MSCCTDNRNMQEQHEMMVMKLMSMNADTGDAPSPAKRSRLKSFVRITSILGVGAILGVSAISVGALWMVKEDLSR